MRTQTIYRAMTGAYRTIIFTQTVDDFLHRKARQWAKFERELLRRMDERDALVTQNTRILGNLQIAWQNNAELARRLYAPKDDGK